MTDSPEELLNHANSEFFAKLGACIASWAEVDDQLFNIFETCVGPREQSAIIYFRIQSLSSRFELTDEIVRSVLPKPSRPKKRGGHDHPTVKLWQTAKGDYQALLNARSRIAHHPINVKEKKGATMRSWFEIYASRHERIREKSSNLKPLKIGDLERHLLAVGSLYLRLRNFSYNVLKKLPE